MRHGRFLLYIFGLKIKIYYLVLKSKFKKIILLYIWTTTLYIIVEGLTQKKHNIFLKQNSI